MYDASWSVQRASSCRCDRAPRLRSTQGTVNRWIFFLFTWTNPGGRPAHRGMTAEERSVGGRRAVSACREMRRQSIPSPLVRRHRGCTALTVGRRHPGRNISHLLVACAVLSRFEGGSSEGGGRGGVWRAGGEAEANGHRLPTKLATMGMGNGNAPGDHRQRDPDHKADMRFVRAGLETHQVSRSCGKCNTESGVISRVGVCDGAGASR
jgi:hypothetical protein